MATTTTADTGLDDAEMQEPKVRRRRGPLIFIALALLLLAAGGGWWLSRDKHPEAESKPAPEKELPPLYLPLESFTVNLQPEVGDQYLQVALSIKIADDPTVDVLKSRMPEVRNRILLLLSSKHASELITLEGKDQLRADIRQELASIVDPAAAHKESAGAKPAAASSTAPPAAMAAPAANAAEAGAVHTAAKPAKTSPVLDVLFTSFIVQ